MDNFKYQKHVFSTVINFKLNNKSFDSEENNEKTKEIKFSRGTIFDGRIIDISGGGIALRMNSKLIAGSTLSLNFDLPGSSLRGIQADILSIHEAGNQEKVFVHRLKFNEIETAVQEKVVRFVFEKSITYYEDVHIYHSKCLQNKNTSARYTFDDDV